MKIDFMSEEYKGQDLTCLAENMVSVVDPAITGINKNEIIVGGTGCGKSMSIGYPRLAHTFNSSIVVPITKKEIMVKFVKLFHKRGYDVEIIDFVNPEASTVSYDPLMFVDEETDAIRLAKSIIEGGNKEKVSKNYDPFWDNAAENVVGALITLLKDNEEMGGKEASLTDVVDIFRNLELYRNGSFTKTNIDSWFEALEDKKPGSQAFTLWKTLTTSPEKTSNCIYAVASAPLGKYSAKSIRGIVSNKKKIDFRRMGEKKTILFVRTSPMDTTLCDFINIMYSDMFRELYESAESNKNGSLKVPVHIICDDFACGGRIEDFDKYISIFRAAGISVSLLLQSESQLFDIYGEGAGKTIINNCDTYIYMGGMDYDTCNNISHKINKPIEKIIGLEKENIIVFRRGAAPVFARRYQTLEDSEYIKAMEL